MVCSCVGVFASNPYVEKDGVMLTLAGCDVVCSTVLSGSLVALVWSVLLFCFVRGGAL